MDPLARLEHLAHGYQASAVLLAAIGTGLIEAVAADPAGADELARRCGLDPRATGVVLHALAGQGILEMNGGKFALAPEFAPLLDPAGPQTQLNIFKHHYYLMKRWAGLDAVLRSGEPAALPDSTEASMRAFICGMDDVSRRSSREAAEAMDLARYRHMLDLGGGPGTAAITFCRAAEGLRATVFDKPGPVAIAREQIEAAGLAGRIDTLAGDFLADPIGSGYDLIYVSNIIHMLSPEQTRALLEKARAALAPGGELAIKEFFLNDDGATPPHASLFSVNMLVNTPGGRAYTRGEVHAMLGELGLGVCGEIEVGARSSIVLGRADG